MGQSRSISLKKWARNFLFEEYRGPPVDYLMAIAAVAAMMIVCSVSIVRELLPEIEVLLTPLALLLFSVLL